MAGLSDRCCGQQGYGIFGRSRSAGLGHGSAERRGSGQSGRREGGTVRVRDAADFGRHQRCGKRGFRARLLRVPTRLRGGGQLRGGGTLRHVAAGQRVCLKVLSGGCGRRGAFSLIFPGIRVARCRGRRADRGDGASLRHGFPRGFLSIRPRRVIRHAAEPDGQGHVQHEHAQNGKFDKAKHRQPAKEPRKTEPCSGGSRFRH